MSQCRERWLFQFKQSKLAFSLPLCSIRTSENWMVPLVLVSQPLLIYNSNANLLQKQVHRYTQKQCFITSYLGILLAQSSWHKLTSLSLQHIKLKDIGKFYNSKYGVKMSDSSDFHKSWRVLTKGKCNILLHAWNYLLAIISIVRWSGNNIVGISQSITYLLPMCISNIHNYCLVPFKEIGAEGMVYWMRAEHVAQNMPLWRIDYFKLTLLRKQLVQERHSEPLPSPWKQKKISHVKAALPVPEVREYPRHQR